MVGSPATKVKDGLTVRLADLVGVRVPALAEATQLVDQPKPCAILPCAKRSAQNQLAGRKKRGWENDLLAHHSYGGYCRGFNPLVPKG